MHLGIHDDFAASSGSAAWQIEPKALDYMFGFAFEMRLAAPDPSDS